MSTTTPTDPAATATPVGDPGKVMPVEPAGPREPAVFLDAVKYSDLVTLDARFPFGVTQKHTADAAIAGSRWGRHGGPMVTTSIYGETGAGVAGVVRWTWPDRREAEGEMRAADATSDAMKKELPIAVAPGLPERHFYGADGMVDLRSMLSLFTYTGTGAGFPGEALLYSADYDRVVGRAHVNGFYSGADIASGAQHRLVYAGLSPLSATVASTNENGLWVADFCEGALLPTAGATSACAAPQKLFAWKGQSGPVAVDAHQNVFVAASLVGAPTSDAVYGLSQAQALGAAPQSFATLAEVDSRGTASIAAVAPEATRDGWLVGLGFDDAAGVYAISYRETADASAVTKSSDVVKRAIVPGADVDGLSFFTDAEGDLWLAVTRGRTGTYLELRPKF